MATTATFKACATVRLGASAAVDSTPVGADVYRAPDLCRSPSISPYLPGGDFTIFVPKVHAQDDYVNNSNGISLRSCSWKGTQNGTKNASFRCTYVGGGTGAWRLFYEIHVVRRQVGSSAVLQDIRSPLRYGCDGKFYEVKIPAAAGRTDQYDHVHVHHDLSAFVLSCADRCDWPTGKTSAGYISNFTFTYRNK